jgi:hypothetical protein
MKYSETPQETTQSPAWCATSAQKEDIIYQKPATNSEFHHRKQILNKLLLRLPALQGHHLGQLNNSDLYKNLFPETPRMSTLFLLPHPRTATTWNLSNMVSDH